MTEEELWIKAKDPDPDTRRDAEGELILVYNNYANRIALNAHKKLPSQVMLDDVQSAAMEGLWDAIKRFDPSVGAPFKAYAQNVINGRVYDYIRGRDVESRSLRTSQKKYRKVEELLEHELKRPPSDREIAIVILSSEDSGDLTEEAVMQDIDRVRNRVHQAHKVSLDKKVGQSTDSPKDLTLADFLAAPGSENLPMDIGKTLAAIIAPWTKVERLIFGLFYLENFSLQKISDTLGIQHTLLCQTHKRMGLQIELLMHECKKD